MIDPDDIDDEEELSEEELEAALAALEQKKQAPPSANDQSLAKAVAAELNPTPAQKPKRPGYEPQRRDFTITKFGRHEDGYFHARVTPSGGEPVYIHCRYGSWLSPQTFRGKEVMKEVRLDVAEELSKMMRSTIRAETRAAEPEDRGGDADGG